MIPKHLMNKCLIYQLVSSLYDADTDAQKNILLELVADIDNEESTFLRDFEENNK